MRDVLIDDWSHSILLPPNTNRRKMTLKSARMTFSESNLESLPTFWSMECFWIDPVFVWSTFEPEEHEEHGEVVTRFSATCSKSTTSLSVLLHQYWVFTPQKKIRHLVLHCITRWHAWISDLTRTNNDIAEKLSFMYMNFWPDSVQLAANPLLVFWS